MDNQTLNIILFGLATYNGILTAVIGYIIKTQTRVFEKMDKNKTECRNMIDANARRDSEDKEELRKEIEDKVDKHYATRGQLTTLEERLLGRINHLDNTIASLNTAVKDFNTLLRSFVTVADKG